MLIRFLGLASVCVVCCLLLACVVLCRLVRLGLVRFGVFGLVWVDGVCVVCARLLCMVCVVLLCLRCCCLFVGVVV